MNISEIAAQVVSEYKANLQGVKNKRFGGVKYIPILEDGSIRVSSYSTSLVGQQECILILWDWELAITNEYAWFEIHYIDKEGFVQDGFEREGCSISVSKSGSWSNDEFYISKFDTGISVRFYNIANTFPKVWELFHEVAKCETAREVQFISRIQDDEKKIEELHQKSIEAALLEEERDQYKEMLDKIKNLVEHSIS